MNIGESESAEDPKVFSVLSHSKECYKCHKRGHIAKDCPTSRNSGQNDESRNNFQHVRGTNYRG